MDRRILTDHLYQGSYEEPLAKVFSNCDICDEEIYEDETYYEINQDIICEDCISDSRRTATLD